MVRPLSSSTENVVLGKTWRILPKTSSGASFALVSVLALVTRGLASRLRLRDLMGTPLTLSATEIPISMMGEDLVAVIGAIWGSGNLVLSFGGRYLSTTRKIALVADRSVS